MKHFETSLVPKSSKKYYCELCDYSSSRLSQYDRHLLTDKHIWNTNETKMEQKVPKKFQCMCGNIFGSRTTLWRHKKGCISQNSNKKAKEMSITEEEIESDEESNISLTDKELIKMLIQQTVKMMEVIQNGTHNNYSHNTHSNNKTFNLQFFLNETCKDAMNMMDFVDNIKLQLSDLENVGEVGYVEGISSIIVKNLQKLDITQRPVHCTDKKRETIYIKDNDKWEKENDDRNILRKAIKRVASRNFKLISEFKEKYPDCRQYHSKYSDQYNKIIYESMGGKGDNDSEKEDKIIRNISKVVTIDKAIQ